MKSLFKIGAVILSVTVFSAWGKEEYWTKQELITLVDKSKEALSTHELAYSKASALKGDYIYLNSFFSIPKHNLAQDTIAEKILQDEKPVSKKNEYSLPSLLHGAYTAYIAALKAYSKKQALQGLKKFTEKDIKRFMSHPS